MNTLSKRNPGGLQGLLALVLLGCLLGVSTLYAQERLQGAWMQQEGDKNMLLLFQDGYLTRTDYTPQAFILSQGGLVESRGDSLRLRWEFDSQTPENVGQVLQGIFQIEGDILTLKLGEKTQTYRRMDTLEEPLAGVWQITQRKQAGQLGPVTHTGTRKTLKILSGNRFQWFAIDPGEKRFNATGGGRYTFEDGVYTEHIEFFSRDSTRVGASLEFQGAIKAGEWHHQGTSSKGQAIYEVWSKVQQ